MLLYSAHNREVKGFWYQLASHAADISTLTNPDVSLSDGLLLSGGAHDRITSVESEEALVAEHLLCAVEAVLVHQLSNKGARGALVLHARLHQVDGVDSCSPGGWKTHILAEVDSVVLDAHTQAENNEGSDHKQPFAVSFSSAVLFVSVSSWW